MFENLLPIGSVVLLNGGTKKLMITGIKQIKEGDSAKEYDYIGVVYPEGYLDHTSQFLFNHADINDVIFTGYSNPERQQFIEFISEAYGKMNG